MKYASKEDLIRSIEDEHALFLDRLSEVAIDQISDAPAWGDGWTVKDLLVHLTEWEQMFIRWYTSGCAGDVVHAPAKGYTWRETPRLNADIQKRHASKSLRIVRKAFDASYAETLELARSIPESDLLTKGVYKWTGKSTLAAYVAANSSSHYRTATKILRRWLRSESSSTTK